MTCALKQQSADRHAAADGYIILIPSQPIFALSPYCSVLSGEAANTNFIGWVNPTVALTRDVATSEANMLTFTPQMRFG